MITKRNSGVSQKPALTSRVVLGSLTTLVCVWLGFLAFIGWAMRQSPETFGRVMSKMPAPLYLVLPFETMWTRARVGQLRPGGTAPDFDLELYDKSGRIQLSSFRGREPVVLVFGSYT